MTARPIGARLLDELHQALTRYVVLPSPEAADAVVLWIAATHAAPAWNCAPRLDITSPVKRCGKSRLLDIIEATCHDPLLTVNISPAALVRSIGDDPPTLLLDEADTVFGPKAGDAHEDLRGILNAGHSRGRPVHPVGRQQPQAWRTARRSPWPRSPESAPCPTPSPTARWSCRCGAAHPANVVDRYRERRDGEPLRVLGERLGEWTRAHMDDLREAEPDMPVEDRAADTWEPLIAVADLAGGDWPARARLRRARAHRRGRHRHHARRPAARPTSATSSATGTRCTARRSSTRSTSIPEAPWGDYFGRPMNARDMAKLLKPYGVSSADVKVDGVNRKGYRREHLHDPWTRYLPPAAGGSATSATSATSQVSDGAPVAGSGQQALPATWTLPLTSDVAQVAQVADTPSGSGYCTVCGEPLWPALAELGDTMHAACDPAVTP